MCETLQIYVACLASYNNGILHGAWIDATQDVELIHSEIKIILEKSPRCHC
ncbi:MAG: antirestriction protein [Gammaproteobacteria bacterium]|jgi:antirestriction protein|nr:antirestriction protein [Gammaproteobacteria bacterium]